MLRNPRLSLLFAIILIDVIVGSAISPVLPSFVAHFPQPQVWMTVSVALFLGMQLFSAPLLGRLSDAWGRRPILWLSTIGTLVANLLLLPLRPWSLFANRGSDGLTNGMYGIIRSAITDLSSPQDLFRNMGLEGAIFSLGFVLGPMLTGLVLTIFSVPTPQQPAVVVALVVGLSALNVGLSFFFQETNVARRTLQRQELWAELVRALRVNQMLAQLLQKNRTKPGLLRLVLMQIALTLATGYYFYLVVFCQTGPLRFDARAVSFFFIYFGLLSIGINYVFYTFLADRIPQLRFISLFALVGLVVLVGYANAGSSWQTFYFWLTIDCFSLSLIQGLIEGQLARLTEPGDRGEIFGINQALQGLASFVNTFVYGVLSWWNLNLPFYWFAACALGIVLLAFHADYGNRRQGQAKSAT